jgi:hypothetical protein
MTNVHAPIFFISFENVAQNNLSKIYFVIVIFADFAIIYLGDSLPCVDLI